MKINFRIILQRPLACNPTAILGVRGSSTRAKIDWVPKITRQKQGQGYSLVRHAGDRWRDEPKLWRPRRWGKGREGNESDLFFTCEARAAVTSFSPNVLSFNWRLTSPELVMLMPSLIFCRIASDPFLLIDFLIQVSAIICKASVSPLAITEGNCAGILCRILST